MHICYAAYLNAVVCFNILFMTDRHSNNITIICADEASALETIAFRGALEYLGFTVSVHWIGNKKDFLDLIQGKSDTDDLIVIASHGEKGKFFMPTDESVPFSELNVNLPNKIVLSVGCDTGGAKDEFIKGKCNAYIAPTDYPEGNDAMMFVIKFFWMLAQEKTVKQAFESSSADMPKGSEFMLVQNPA